MNNKELLRYLPYVMFPTAVLSVQPYTTVQLGNTTFWWFIQLGILYLFFLGRGYFYDKQENRSFLFISIYLGYIVFSFFHGVYMAEIYWDWKTLISNSMALLLPVFTYIATNIYVNQSMLNRFVIWVLPSFFLYVPFISVGSYGDYLYPIAFLSFFLPLLKIRHRLVVVFFSFLVLTVSLGARSDIIKFGTPFLLLLAYYIKPLANTALLGFGRLVFMFAPMILFLMALSGFFNPFAMEDYVKGDYEEVTVQEDGTITQDNLKADTRTPLYVEVLLSAKKHNYWLIGRSPARGNDSQLFGQVMERITGRAERYRNETSILNIFTWTGLVGVVLFFLIYWRASYLAIHRSNNVFAKMLGVYVAFRWTYAWVEDINDFNLNYLVLWMIIGICMSHKFRSLSDVEVKIWARGIFNKRYRVLLGE